MTRPVTDYRLELREAGYEPLPVNGKAAVIEGWQEHVATADGIQTWPKQYKGALNTGILTRNTPTFDCDIMDEVAATAIEKLLRARFDKCGRVLVRIGRAPKFAVPFRTAEPFAKYAVSLIGPDGSPEHKIEMLGNGQQVLMDGIHKDTGKPYKWRGGRPGTEVPWGELPEITEEEAHALVDDAVGLLIAKHGFLLAARDGKGKASETDLIMNVIEGTALHDSLRDLAAKYVVQGKSEEEAETVLRGMMERSDAPRDGRWQERFDSIPRLVKSAVKKVNSGEWNANYNPGTVGPVPLGYYRDGHWALLDQVRKLLLPSTNSNQLLAANCLVGYAPPEFWAKQFPKKGGGFSSYAAGLALIEACKRAGPFDPLKVRGRGVWREGERVVINFGGELPPNLGYTYLCFERTSLPTVTEFETERLLAMLRIFPWREPSSAVLLLGFAAYAPVCGVVEWRPHVFTYGEKASGKTALHRVLARLLEPLCLSATGESTEAGIRQRLGADSLPVVVDDFESERDNDNVRRVIQLARASSSADSSTLRGTPEGKALQFVPRATFMFGGINPAGLAPQDEDRIVQLELTRHRNDREEGVRLKAEMTHFRELGREWCGYCVGNVEKMLAAIDMLNATLDEKNQRTRLTFATLLGAAFVALYRKIPSAEEAAAWAKEHAGAVRRHAIGTERSNAEEALAHLLAHVPIGEKHNLGTFMRLGLMEISDKKDPLYELARQALRVLYNYGICTEDDQVFVANHAPKTEELYARTVWKDGGWMKALRQLNGACVPENPEWVGGKKQRCTALSGWLVPEDLPVVPEEETRPC